MPFLVIPGSFRVVGRGQNGQPTGFQPDGDSIQFRPAQAELLDKLKRRSASYHLTSIGSVNLRFEGIDALELHYMGSRQPEPLPEEARHRVLQLVGIHGVRFDGTTVKPPVPTDGQPGYVLSRELDDNGRPVSFAYTGDPGAPFSPGKWARLTPRALHDSLNYKLLHNGLAYPLFYDTLFSDLRAELAQAANDARARSSGVWRYDPTHAAPAGDGQVIQISSVLYPKLFRRLVDFYRAGNSDLGDLARWMDEHHENDVVTVLSQSSHTTHFDNVLDVSGTEIALKFEPTDLVFRAR